MGVANHARNSLFAGLFNAVTREGGSAPLYFVTLGEEAKKLERKTGCRH